MTPQWQAIETAPKDGTDVLVCLSNGLMTVAGWDGMRQEWVPCAVDGEHARSVYVDGTPTHWQALPPAPGK